MQLKGVEMPQLSYVQYSTVSARDLSLLKLGHLKKNNDKERHGDLTKLKSKSDVNFK